LVNDPPKTWLSIRHAANEPERNDKKAVEDAEEVAATIED
jgi:hypothetical protein